jgi:hypothetical protein
MFSRLFRNAELRSPGIPHRLMADDEYNGYRLPAGSIVAGNSWYVLRFLAASTLDGIPQSSQVNSA